MSSHHEEGSVTRCIGDLIEGGDIDEAVQTLWERYYSRLVELARSRLGAAPRVVADEEDAALSAFDSFCRGAADGRYPQLGGRDDLWRLLVTITGRKVIDHIERELAQKRDTRRTLSERELAGSSSDGESGGGLAQIIGREPSPEFAAVVAEECRALLDRLDDTQRQVALLKMEGYRNEEIAKRIGCSKRKVERTLGLIRKYWVDRRPS